MVSVNNINEIDNPSYKMTISFNVLNHLGANLYSSISAVLTEAVANSWDADADEVNIQINDSTSIVITDNGCGMDEQDINACFLNVGYSRRENSPTITPIFKRKVMGRKGIGKLSLFSVARVITVMTVKNSQKYGFVMNVDDIDNLLKNDANPTYEPRALTTSEIDIEVGTKIILTQLNNKRTAAESFIRKRLARRFSVIGPANNFEVSINQSPISVSDRDYYSKVEYLWTMGDKDKTTSVVEAINASHHAHNEGLVEPQQQFEAEGWIGTVKTSGDLKEQGGANLNSIVLMARGRVVHENILEAINDGRLFTKYIIGEINADFLDQDDKEDIATSSRQALVEDDERYGLIVAFTKKRLNEIGKVWNDLRKSDGADKAMQENTAIAEWINGMPSSRKEGARTLMSYIGHLDFDRPEDKKELYRHGVIAYEKIRMQDQLEHLDTLTTFNPEQFKLIFDDVDALEAHLYHDIVKERLAVIKQLQKITDENVLETEVQSHIFDHLWLVDPSWERATGSERIEEGLKKEFDVVSSLSDKEKKSRLDIRYQKTAGGHVIVELKRQGRTVSAEELYKQGKKYRSGLKKCLSAQNQELPISVIFLVGSHPKEDDVGETSDLMRLINGRCLTYREIITNAIEAYGQYLKAAKITDNIEKIINKI